MSTDISIRVPKEMATPAEFAEWRVFPAALFTKKFTMVNLLSTWSRKKKNKGRVSLRYLMYKTDQVRESLGHSNFRVIVGK